MAMGNLTWNYITIAAIADPPWSPSTYAAPSFVVDAIATGAAIYVFCISDAGVGGAAQIVTVSGSAIIPSGSITVVSTPPLDTTVMDNGETWYSARTPAGGMWQFYGDTTGIVRSLAVPAALGAFIS